jgi:uncharacterized protein YeaO (DUF488 family)
MCGLVTKRIYESTTESDGKRILVDRLWPRGISKERASLDLWLKEIAPSDGLRLWFGHRSDRWSEFKVRYFQELTDKQDEVGQIETLSAVGTITLVYAAQDTLHNNAVALAEYLSQRRHREC